MKAIVTSSVIALALLTAGATQAFPGPGWGEGCQGYGPGYGSGNGPGYGMYKGGPRYFGPGRGFGGQRGCMQGKTGNRFQATMSGLDLTDEQQTELNAIHDEYRQKMSAHRSKMRDNRVTIRDVNRKFPVDMAEVQKLAELRGDLVTEKITLRAEKHEKVQQVLTAEQRSKWQDAMQQRPRRWNN